MRSRIVIINVRDDVATTSPATKRDEKGGADRISEDSSPTIPPRTHHPRNCSSLCLVVGDVTAAEPNTTGTGSCFNLAVSDLAGKETPEARPREPT